MKDNYTSFGKPIDPNDVLIRSLETQGIQRLYTIPADSLTPGNPDAAVITTKINTNNHKKELKKLNHSILIAYLDLLEILVKAPNTQIIETPPQHDINGQLVDEAGNPLDPNNPQHQHLIMPPVVKTLREQKLEDIELLFINMHHLINELRPHQARDNIRCILEMQKQQRIQIAQKFKQHLFKIVELLKSCIQSIQNSSKNDAYIDELNSLISNASQLTKSLDKFGPNEDNKKSDTQSTTTSDIALTNGHYHHSNDIEMKSEELTTQVEQLKQQISNNINNKSKISVKNTAQTNQQQACSSMCDFKDLILCDLIDDFLIKENEF